MKNDAQKSFHSLLKYEDAFNAIFVYIEDFYTPNRIHTFIGYLSPNDFEKLHKNI